MSHGGTFLLNEALQSAVWQGGGWTVDTGNRVVRAGAIVNAAGPIRQIVAGNAGAPPRFLVIVAGTPTQLGAPVQVQSR